MNRHFTVRNSESELWSGPHEIGKAERLHVGVNALAVAACLQLKQPLSSHNYELPCWLIPVYTQVVPTQFATLTRMLASKHLRSAACSQHSGRISRRSAVVCLAAGPRSPSEPSTSAPALSAIAAAAAATVIQLSAATSAFAAPLYDNLPGFGADSQSVFFQAVEQEIQNRPTTIDDLFDENLTTVELRTFVDNVVNNKLKPEQYQVRRSC